jgi:hypothetical protein
MKVAFISFLFLFPPQVQTDCALKKEQDGIKVYTCKSEGERFKSLRAEFTLENTSVDQLEKFLLDVPFYTKWQYNMIEATLLTKTSDQEMTYRTVVDAPWPVENRELIVKYVSIKDTVQQTMDIIIQNIQSDYPKQEDVVRVPSSYGVWHIVKVGNNLKVDYALNIDPGGSLPAWLVNMAMADGPHQSFRNLKRELQKKSGG